ncbi:MAG: SDR family NAD(P)-dependent oxidoreductase, partial [Bacteroidota bacterium]
MNRLQNKVAVITGGARGIGKATAKKFMGEGATVAIWDINENLGKATAAELEKEGTGQVRFYKVNTSSLAAVSAAAAQVMEDFGSIDILINNAGITRDASLKKMTGEQWQQVIDVNLTGVFNCTKAIYPYMVEREDGRIINAASVVAHNG